MNTQELKTLRSRLSRFDDETSQRAVCAINCALMNTHEPVTKEWLREELDRYLSSEPKILPADKRQTAMLSDREKNCPAFHDHTPCPDGYIAWHAWHAWARKMARTHRQIKYAGCGLWAIWIERPKKPCVDGDPERVKHHPADTGPINDS